MMAGQVLPPGCFLDAPGDAQAPDRGARHGRVGAAGGRRSRASRTRPASSWARPGENASPAASSSSTARTARISRARSSTRFDDLSEPARTASGSWSSRSGDAVPELVEQAFEQIADRARRAPQPPGHARRSASRRSRTTRSRRTTRRQRRRSSRRRASCSARLIVELRHKYPLNVLTDEGVLPNYAFPEPGVTLESVVSHEQGETASGTTRRDEYIRPGEQRHPRAGAVQHLLRRWPQGRIDEIDIGSKARRLLETWRLCRECSYMRREFAGAAGGERVPALRRRQWSDAGQVRTLVHFRRSRSLATRSSPRRSTTPTIARRSSTKTST